MFHFLSPKKADAAHRDGIGYFSYAWQVSYFLSGRNEANVPPTAAPKIYDTIRIQSFEIINSLRT
jgi:hypothetical protein